MDSIDGRELLMEQETGSKVLNINLNFCTTCKKEKIEMEVCEQCLPLGQVIQENRETNIEKCTKIFKYNISAQEFIPSGPKMRLNK